MKSDNKYVLSYDINANWRLIGLLHIVEDILGVIFIVDISNWNLDKVESLVILIHIFLRRWYILRTLHQTLKNYIEK